MDTLRPIGTVFEDVLEYPDKRVIVKRRVIGYHDSMTEGEIELTQEVGREVQPKQTNRPTETK